MIIKEMNYKIKLIVITILVLAILLVITGCSGRKAECKVTLDRQGNLDIIVNPPGESGQVVKEGSLQEETSSGLDSDGSFSTVTTYVGELKFNYPETGNSYTVSVNITIEEEQLVAYELTVTGGVYGETPHHCSKIPAEEEKSYEGEVTLTNNHAKDEYPSWSPDGKMIAFDSERDGNPEIYVMNADGSGQTNISNNPGARDSNPVWSPDGKKIAFSSERDGNYDIYVINTEVLGRQG